ncbi:ABC transporter substrate-binding protein [Sporolactobacillus shoreicorticis]|uniref:ABC transporter substrate-binding protein n=1 Tax=Sporolactobacillus shoreicorticis TaxID=1923877 RepID=A0ABW5S3H6_9BACL|nr:ABC transporter substrate-binding protein [Sporolactobacillus shoreicorticis]MCO7124418.1 ABC transporter substrate-binding protein [Sporolactobacillus shoreicorticis]
MKIVKYLIVSLLLLGILAGCGTSQSTGSSESKQGENKLTGILTFYTSQPDTDEQKLVAAFNKKYPDVKVNVFRSGTEDVMSKIQAEKKSGKVQADVLLLADAVTFETLKDEDMLMAYKSKEAADFPKELIDSDGYYTGTKVMATALAINTKKVKEEPDSWSVLTDSKTKGQAIMPSPLYSGAAAYNLGVFTRNDRFGWPFYKNLKKNQVTVVQGNGDVLKAVASGNKSYGMVVDFVVANAAKQGSPIKLIYPSEGSPVITEPIGIMKDTKNEKAAKAFVDFVLSEEGQELAAGLGYTPIRPGVKAPEGLKSIDDLKVLSADIKTLNQSRNDDKDEFMNLFGK